MNSSFTDATPRQFLKSRKQNFKFPIQIYEIIVKLKNKNCFVYSVKFITNEVIKIFEYLH